MTIFDTLETYYDAAPRPLADVTEVGPFTVFVGQVWPYYARPRLREPHDYTADDLRAVLDWQAAQGVPQAVEWVAETTPSLASVAEASSLTLHRYPLMVLEGDVRVPEETGDITVRMLTADDAELVATTAAIDVGFGNEGTASGAAGEDDRDALMPGAADRAATHARRIGNGQSQMATAVGPHGPVGGGNHNPVGPTTELVGVAVLPAYRRRGLGARLTAALAADAIGRGVDTVFLSAGSDDVARVYAGIGFQRVGTACVLEV